MSDIFRDYSFGGWLKSFRIEKQITLRKMAKAIDIDAANYCKIERSEQIPNSKDKVLALVAPLELSAAQKDLLVSLAFQHQLAKLKEKWK